MTQWQDGPVVTEGAATASAIVVSLAAAPSAAGAHIVVSLSASATVDVRILNIAGRAVGTLWQGRAYGAGTSTLIWNARSDDGLAVPNGTYLVETTARGPSGG